MLFSRTLFFAVFQGLIAGFLAFADLPSPGMILLPGGQSVRYLLTSFQSFCWPVFRQENKRFFDFIPPSRQAMWKDIGIVLILMVAVVPIATFPNLWLANLLFGSNDIAFLLLFRPLPLWAGIVSFLFPITIAFAELPTYFGYIMPHLDKQLGNGWLAWGLASLFLALQHVTLPLILDWRFIVWRFGMFIPLAFFMGLCLKLRPHLFPEFDDCSYLT